MLVNNGRKWLTSDRDNNYCFACRRPSRIVEGEQNEIEVEGNALTFRHC